MTENWPVADLDPVRRLRVLAAAVRFPVYVSEVVLPAPVERVWAAAADLERALPSFTAPSAPRALPGPRVTGSSSWPSGTLGQRARFDVVLRPGWCLMRSRFVLGAMAAVPEAGGTRFAALGGFRLPGARLAGPLLTVLGDRSMRAFAEHLELHAHP